MASFGRLGLCMANLYREWRRAMRQGGEDCLTNPAQAVLDLYHGMDDHVPFLTSLSASTWLTATIRTH